MAGPVRGLAAPLGAALIAALAAWPLLVHGSTAGSVRFTATVLGAAFSYVLGGLLTRLSPLAVPVLLVAAVSVAFVATLPASLQGGAAAPPLGYGNANGALLAAVVAGVVGSTLAVQRARGLPVAVMAVPFTVAALLTGSVASALTCIALLALAPALRRGPVAAWRWAAGLVLLVAFSATVVAGATYRSGSDLRALLPAGAGSRAALWSDALDLATDHPVAGVGPGRFAQLSPTAVDPDLAWAHSEPLQMLAETGFVGLALLVAVVVWLCLRLGRGAAILALVALQPMVDYVLHFPAVTVALGLVLGSLDQARTGR